MKIVSELNSEKFKVIMIRVLRRVGTSLSLNGSSCQLQVSSRCHNSSKIFQEQVSTSRPRKKSYEIIEASKTRDIDAFALSMLIFPITSFGLGVWQIKRKAWKENLIEELKKKTRQEPVALPQNLEDLESMEFCPVRVKGKFHHDREIYIGPRSLLLDEGKSNVSSGLVSHAKVGYLVVTPFELSDSGKTILVNRGWIPSEKYKNRSKYIENDIDTEVELTGLVRLHERRPSLGMQNDPERRLFIYRDLHQMAEVAKSEPIFIDASASSTIPGGPIGGQTRVALRNEHFGYIVTWFGLSVATGVMWYLKFVRFSHLR